LNLQKRCYTTLREIEVPGTELHINPHSKTLVVSPKGYFRYQAKNPPEAKYIRIC